MISILLPSPATHRPLALAIGENRSTSIWIK